MLLFLTEFCGMAMSVYAAPFFYGMVPVTFARRFHLSLSYWSFVLMGLHLGLHIPLMTAGMKISNKIKVRLFVLFCILSGCGFYLFLSRRRMAYLLFQVVFAFPDNAGSAALVFLENLLILLFFVFVGATCFMLCRNVTERRRFFGCNRQRNAGQSGEAKQVKTDR
jgi:hypothetical protein